MRPEFSVLLSVYAKEKESFFDAALSSLVEQTWQPNEILIVMDGPIGKDLQNTLDRYIRSNPSLFKVVALKENAGLGIALQQGLLQTMYEIVMRMDTDDIADKRRCEKQVGYLANNPTCDVLGSSIQEFMDSPQNPVRYRLVPTDHKSILKIAKRKNPMNHMTVVFRKSKVLLAGNYQHMPYFEDYDLWVRMLSQKMIFSNLPEPLVFARVGNDMVGKRHGLAYVRHEISFFKKIYQNGFINLKDYIAAVSIRVPLRLIPKNLLEIIYNFALRRKNL
jgi:glycosyltransferase involved in cell wall biosynthesis